MSAAPKLQDKPVVRQSDISAFQMCGQQWKFSRVDNIPAPGSPEMTIGTVVDRVANANLLNRLNNGADLALAEAAQIATTVFESLKPATAFDEDMTAAEALDAIRFMVDVYLTNVAPQVKPKIDLGAAAIQRPFHVNIDDQPFDISGTTDLIEEGHVISDLKTTAYASRNNFSVSHSNQPALYSLAYKAEFGVEPTFRYMLLFRPNKTEMKAWKAGALSQEDRNKKVMFVEGKCSQADLDMVLHAAATTYKMMDAKIYPLASERGWWCSQNGCAYWNICKGRK
jgi:hypothetical protein